MNAQQLTLFKQTLPKPDPDTLQADICSVKSAIESSKIPLTSPEISKISGISRSRVFAALVELHKQGEIGWASRAEPEGSRATDEPEQPTVNTFEVARPDENGGSPTVKVKAFKKSDSELFYNYVCWGKEKSDRAYLGGGNVDTHLAKIYKAKVETAIATGRFDGCVTRSDYYQVINQLKSEVEF
ncbi:hypothetical protein ACL6C3_16820 [Capilliphycus salinus ALCB114379]|uniref:hypothetical protein n=1 Tax=Capilliphycus salinus TaxID=2768948 RepID=UPI0039A703CE